MNDAFSCFSIARGMFSPEFLRRIVDENSGLDGCSPSDYGVHESVEKNLNDHLKDLWIRSIASWNRLGPSMNRELSAAKVKVFIQRLMQDLGLDLTGLPGHVSGGKLPKITYDLGGSLWHVVSSKLELDVRSDNIGAKRSSPHNLMQSQLNSSKHHGWGLLTNGRQFRILRKTKRKNIQEALEFDVERMFNQEHYADFCLFAMVVHGTRWSRNKDAPMDCWLETWYDASKDVGSSALEDLRNCVKDAAESFGTGLIGTSAGNHELRSKFEDVPNMEHKLQKEIMRYMYKLIFLFVMEDRDLLLRGHGEEPSPEVEEARERYMNNYSTTRHRNVTTYEKGDDRHHYFEEVKQVMTFLSKGEDELALPALGSYLFSGNSTELIDQCTLQNIDFMETLKHLCTFENRDGRLQRVDWRNLRETELGSVYESLLEFRPIVDLENNTFILEPQAGNDRKSSGSYYTPSELVDHLIMATIDPLLEEAKKRARKASSSAPDAYQQLAREAVLGLTVCDPACGSGHFLVAVLERIAMELARIETGEEHPGLSIIHKSKRLASTKCIYGVDLNPLAVELCKVAIWMDTYDGSNPLNFLDSHIRQGNSLLGERMNAMGLIPDDALPPAWAKQRKAHRKYNTARKAENLGKLQRELDDVNVQIKRRTGNKQKSGLSAFGFEMPAPIENSLQALSDEELKRKKEELEIIIERKDAHVLVPSETMWSLIDIPRLLKKIAEEQSKFTTMEETSIEDVERKEANHLRLSKNSNFEFAKEVLDAHMAMWWWPNPNVNEHNKMVAEPPVPLSSAEFNRYAIWLADLFDLRESVVKDQVFSKALTDLEHQRFARIRDLTQQIAKEHSFFHWELEFAEVFYNEDKVRERGFSATLANPPFINAWKQHEDMEQSRQFLADQGGNFLTKHWDLSAAFLLQSQRSTHGAIGMILPTSLLLQPHGMPVRRFHVQNRSLIVDWTGKKWFKDASVEVYSSVTNRLKAYDHYQQLQGSDPEDLLTSPVSLNSKFLGAEEDYAYMPNTVPFAQALQKISKPLGCYVHINYGAQVSPKEKGGTKADNLRQSADECVNPKPYTEGKYIKKEHPKLAWESSQYLDYQRGKLYGPRTEEFFESPKLVMMRLSQNEFPTWYDDTGIYLNHSVLIGVLHESLPEAYQKDFGYEVISKYTLEQLNLLIQNKYTIEHYLNTLKQGTDNYPKAVREILIPTLSPKIIDACLEKETWEGAIQAITREIQLLMKNEID